MGGLLSILQAQHFRSAKWLTYVRADQKYFVKTVFFSGKLNFQKKKAIFSQWRSAFAGEIYFPQEQFSQNFKLLFTNSVSGDTIHFLGFKIKSLHFCSRGGIIFHTGL